MKPIALFLLLLLSAVAHAEDVYDIRPLSEGELISTYENLILDACRHSDDQWHDWPVDSRAGHWGTGVSGGNEGIRAISNMVLASGALLKYSDSLTDDERRELMRKATAAVRYVVLTHKSGTQKCTDGKQWGGDWQSAYWAGTMAFGAWLFWEDLEPELQQGVERVIASEADRFLAVKPQSQQRIDTKAEENGWNVICLSAAANMFPSHAHANAWREKSIEYMMNTLSVPSDLKDNTLVDGRRVRDWVGGANLHPDFTLENHGMFHPAYLECSTYFLTQAAMHNTYARQPVPQAVDRHLMDTWQVLRSIMLPCGESAFPQGMDWELHGLPNINLLASLATYKKDALAAGMEKIVLQRMRSWQKMQGGDLAVPGSRLGFTRHAIVAEQATNGYLAHKLFGPPSDETTISDIASRLNYVREFGALNLIVHRTEEKLFSFSWKSRTMGVLVPIKGGHEGNPHFTVPILNGFVGTFELSGGGDTATNVVEWEWEKTANGFDTTGEVLTNGELLKQTIRVSSICDNTVIYQDRISALSDVTVARELGVPIGIENDELSGGKRIVYHRDGKSVVNWQEEPRDIKLSGGWANVDARLGIVMIAGSGMTYRQASGYNPQAVCADVLFGSFSDQPRTYKAGDEVSRRVVLFCVETTPEETSALSDSVNVEPTQEGEVLRFKLPEGGHVAVPLM
jgi:hypothetical protein